MYREAKSFLVIRMNKVPFLSGKWYKLGDLRSFAKENLRNRQEDRTFSAAMRKQPEKWIKDWNEEIYPLKVFVDHKALSDDAEFCWTPDSSADFTIRSNERTIKIQNTMAYAEWKNSSAKQGGHLHKLEMVQANKVGHSFPGGLVSEPSARSAETDVEAWRRGITKAVKRKLKSKYSGVHLLIFARRCRFQTIDFPFEQVVAPAIEVVGRSECERIFAGLYVFDDQPSAIFELKP
jgi:hypothetical protein